MAENTAIEWADHTFNPWIGCQKVSAGCDHCYAETMMADRLKAVEWGPGAARKRTAAANWNKPLIWNRKAAAAGQRARVFCASLADVFDNKAPAGARDDLFRLIRQTPNLDWMLLTKRPQNMPAMMPDDWGPGYPNVWLGATAENAEEYLRRWAYLLSVPAARRFLSCEPLLGPVDLGNPSGLHWVIAGGESGPKARPANPAWFRSLRDQCAARGIPFLFKQWGEHDAGGNRVGKKAAGRQLDGRVHHAFPESAAIADPATDRGYLSMIEGIG